MKVALRTLAFIAKEIQAIFVQPQLLLLLVAGPFLVLFAFGVGYRPEGPDLRTIVVQPAPGDPQQTIGLFLSAIGRPIHVVEVTSELEPSLAELRAREVDLVVVVPPGAQEMILEGQVARLQFYHHAIDPARIGYIKAVIDGATSQLNRAIVKQAVGEQQASASDYEQVLTALQGELAEIKAAEDSGDRARAQQLSRSVRINSGLAASLWLFAAEPLAESTAPAARLATQARELDRLLASEDVSPQAVEQILEEMQASTGRMLRALQRSRKIPPEVFVAPLAWEAKGISPYLPGYVAYHSPTVVALLVQHLCITLAALSLVDERSAGAVELFRASPVRPGEILLGKFAAYLLFIAVIATGLLGLLIYGLRVPLLGDWRWLAVIVAALVVYSLNVGFLISAVARSRSQAIQMSMLVLLGSIFFSGLFVPLEDFVIPLRAVSYSLPITYGMEGLRQVVLRGERPDPLSLSAMVSWAVLLGGLTMRLFRRLYVGHL
jgi:ABC-2 type transport system permease protein